MIKQGSGRIVLILFKKFVIKIPKNLFGIQSNWDELIRWIIYKDFRFFLCPRIFLSRIFLFGLIIMPYCLDISHATPEHLEEVSQIIEKHPEHPLLKDLKGENVGIYKGHIVRIYYGRGTNIVDALIKIQE